MELAYSEFMSTAENPNFVSKRAWALGADINSQSILPPPSRIPTNAPSRFPTKETPFPTATIQAIQTPSPSSSEPTSSPYAKATTSPTPIPTPIPYCPPTYDLTKTDYVEGQRVEVEGFIFECRERTDEVDYVPYCNTPYPDQLNEIERGVWENAWATVSACYTTMTPTSEPTDSPTPVPYCPPAYDLIKSDYVAGDKVEVEGFAFECNRGGVDGVEYVPYCNTPYPDHLDEEDMEMWNDAWVEISACYVTTTPTSGPPIEMPTTNPSVRPTGAPSG